MSGARLLVIDDERAVLRALATGLRARGYEVSTAVNAVEGLSKAALESPDVIVLDLGLPDLDGVEVCRRIRQWTETPIVVLSADGAEARKVEALDQGADDFVTKPFGMAELEARLRVALRHGSRPAAPETTASLCVGAVTVDLLSRSVTVRGTQVTLTRTEFDLLAFLARHPGRVITHRMLLEEVWGPDYVGQDQYVRVYANHLRKKIEVDPSRPKILLTSPGVGYQLVDPGDGAS